MTSIQPAHENEVIQTQVAVTRPKSIVQIQLQEEDQVHQPWAMASSPKTTQEVRRIVPENKQGLPTVKIVYVVLEAQYQSSLTAAIQSLNSGNRHASFQVVGYLVEELRDADTYKMFCQYLEDANIFIGSLIFVEELAVKVKEDVEKQRDRMDAVLVFPSMPEVMRLNKLGSFSMSQLG
ncbi:hypothetical protein TB1_026975 [Malus domestica]